MFRLMGLFIRLVLGYFCELLSVFVTALEIHMSFSLDLCNRFLCQTGDVKTVTINGEDSDEI